MGSYDPQMLLIENIASIAHEFDKVFIRVTMEDHSVYEVPAHIIAHFRAEYYANLDVGDRANIDSFDMSKKWIDVYYDEFKFTIHNDFELKDWARGNMNWSDVKEYATRIDESQDINFQEGWVNGPMDIIRENG